jgi:Transient receptor potential (TRP) ion channel
LAIFPLLIFIFYQWMLKDSWLSILLSVLTLLAITVLVAYPAFQTLRVARRKSSSSSLYAHNELHLSRNGPLYAQYRPSRYFFFLILLGGFFLRAILIAFAQASGDVQLALMIVVEFLFVVAHLALKPFKTKGGDVFLTYLAITRFVCTALMISFLETLNITPITRVVVGIFIAVIFSVSIIVVFLNLVLHTVGGLFRRKRENLPVASSAGSSDGLMLEKGNAEGTKTPSDLERQISPGDDVSCGDSPDQPDDRIVLSDETVPERPLNPTPNQSTVQVQPYTENPYPLSPTGTTVSTMDPPSLDSRDSGTMTVGSLLSRRWSFLSFSRASSPILGRPSLQASLSPTSIPTTPVSLEHGAHSRNASLKPRHQHDYIKEESGATSSKISS